MTSEFLVYLRLGFEHISDLKGYDHILFIVALCAVYHFKAWKRLLWLVTAFTVGHSVTLALATLRLVTIDATLVEVLIPVTILLTSLLDVAAPAEVQQDRAARYKYGLALGFGLIHGLGFSNFLRAVLGGEESIALPLFAFNVGLELGQIVIVFVVLMLSGATAAISLLMIIQRLTA